MQIPKTILYSNEHLWTKASADGAWEAGITDYAQDLLGDIVFIEAPAIGTKLAAGKPCGLVESVKTGSDLHALVDGEVIEINQELINSPELINEKPYQAWIFKYRPTYDDVSKTLLSAEAYQALLDGVA
ncbi:glycine cleavage system protein GcvH [Methylotenera sp.]|uniref:glycine cleavage system protein GcvH n=1 Tax=Methylotenera sp. TaxID=2051956 RepID=UPI00248749D3|nr:glycine cleavage system protein GcvH [Methylotenera sp.]MDI1297577.1 glycine cleavage system protein GcvH [Methylotenera sp.]